MSPLTNRKDKKLTFVVVGIGKVPRARRTARRDDASYSPGNTLSSKHGAIWVQLA